MDMKNIGHILIAFILAILSLIIGYQLKGNDFSEIFILGGIITLLIAILSVSSIIVFFIIKLLPR